MIRKRTRNGVTHLFIDIHYQRKDGTRARFRKDAEVQKMAEARAEERRYLACIAQYGDPFEPATASPKASPAGAATPAGSGITFAEAVAQFRAGKAVTAFKPSTRKTYEEIIEGRLLPRLRAEPLTAINFDVVNRLDADLVKEGASPSRRRNVQIALRSILSAACDSGKLATMPKLPNLPKVGEKILRVLSREELAKLLDAAPPSARLAFALGAYAGLRAGEVRGLRWSDITIKPAPHGGPGAAGEIIVRQAVCKGEACTPKSGHQRRIPIAAPLLPILQEAAQRRGTISDSTPVALTELGRPWGEWGLNQALKRAARRAGLAPQWRFHDLRHAFVTGMFRSGAPAPVVQALAGHLELTTTQRYAHTVEDDLHEAVRRFGTFTQPPPPPPSPSLPPVVAPRRHHGNG